MLTVDRNIEQIQSYLNVFYYHPGSEKVYDGCREGLKDDRRK